MDEEINISDEDLETVDSVYSKILEIEDTSLIAWPLKTVFLVENYNQEINSGLDFIQWLRWSDVNQYQETLNALKEVGLTESFRICSDALSSCFPNGFSITSEEKEEFLDALDEDDNKAHLRESLASLAEKQEEQNYNLTTGLASWIRKNIS